MTDIWAAVCGEARPRPLTGEILRLVESQEQVATNRLVATLAEQDLLESMLEASKPATATNARLASTTCSPRRFVIRPCRTARASAAGTSRASSTQRAASPPCSPNPRITASCSGRGCASRRPCRCAPSTRCSVRGCARGAATRCSSRRSPLSARCWRAATTTGPRSSSAEPCVMRAPTPSNTSRRATRRAVSTSRSTRLRRSRQPRPTFKEEWLCETRADEVELLRTRRRWAARVSAVAIHESRSAAGAGGVIWLAAARAASAAASPESFAGPAHRFSSSRHSGSTETKRGMTPKAPSSRSSSR